MRNLKLAIWGFLCLILSFSFRQIFIDIPRIFSLQYLRSAGVYPWVVIALCFLWLFIKRSEILEKLEGEELLPSYPFAFAGAVSLAISVVSVNKFSNLPLEIFFLLLSFVSLFAIFFGSASAIPYALTGIYGFSTAFPLFVSNFLEGPYSGLSIWFTAGALKVLGISPEVNGQVMEFVANSGKISVLVDSRCSGTASVGVFLALFALMFLDMPLAPGKTVKLLVLGVAGTFFQNILRLVVVLLAGYLYGYQALWSAHAYAGYIIFFAWFAVFALIYLRQAKA